MKLLTTLLFIIALASCKTKSNTTIPTYTSELPKDSLAFYFPINTFHDKLEADSFTQNWYSSTLHSFKEPVLSQSFVGHNVYRFLWSRSFHRPVVFVIHQSEDQVWLNTKMLDMQPRFYDDRIGGITKEDQQEYIREGYSIDKKRPDLMVRIADRKAYIIYNKNISLSDNEWTNFEKLLEKANFWSLPTNINDGSNDGAQWVIEGHFKNKYQVVNYHSPGNNEYAKAGRFLIKLSELHEEKIY